MFGKSPSDKYHQSLEKLKQAEQSHRETLDQLDQAIKDKRPSSITSLRLKARETEEKLKAALQAAASCHLDYWVQRKELIMPEVLAAAETLVKFKHIARAAGAASVDPIAAVLVEHSGRVKANEIVEGVPIESPDSELLEDFLGSWK